MMRAYWQHQTGDTASARRTLDGVMKLYPKLAEPWVRLGMLASAEKRTADARSAYKAALERDANHPVALNNLAMISLEAGENPNVAEGMIRKALKVLPNNGALQDTLATVLVAKKDARGALAAIQLAAKLSPNDPGIQLHLAEILLLNGDKVAAKRTAEALKPGPGVDPGRLAAVLR
jgi:Flp pilus assembly protein TadD